MFSRARRGDHLVRMVVWIAAHRHHIDIWISQHFFQVAVSGDGAAVLVTELLRVQFTRGKDRGDLRRSRGVDRRDVRARHPPVTDDADIVFLHSSKSPQAERLEQSAMAKRCQSKRAMVKDWKFALAL